MDLSTADKLLTTTRAVRKRLDLSRPVSEDVILECLRIAIQAPTGSNAQRWSWLVITEPRLRTQIAALYRDRGEAPTTAVLPEVPDSRQQRRVMESVDYLRDHLEEVPVLVIPCIEEKGGAAGWAPSIYPAVWNFMLALRSRGLGSCMTTAHLYRRREAAAILGIPDGVAQACLLPVAYYKGGDFRPAVRAPIEEITFWDGWGQVRATP
jgi:nitroreductase